MTIMNIGKRMVLLVAAIAAGTAIAAQQDDTPAAEKPAAKATAKPAAKTAAKPAKKPAAKDTAKPTAAKAAPKTTPAKSTPAKTAAAKSTSAPAPAAKPATPPVAVGPGDVTRTQMRAQVRAIFDRADLDKDDFMSREEFAGRMAAVLNRRPPGSAEAPTKEEAQRTLDAAFAAFKAVDTDGDGKLNRVEASRRPLKAFDMMDANHDGVLTVAEKVAARAAPAAAVGVPTATAPAGSGTPATDAP